MQEKGVPRSIINEIKKHLKNASKEGEKGWEYANQEEDTLTGDYLGRLRTGINTRDDWSWKIKYHKFRGRGKGAYEKKVGADGIITIEIQKNGIRETKSIIFQAKKKGNNQTTNQLSKMKSTLPDGNMMIVFSPDGYFGETGDGFTNDRNLKTRIGDYLADVFVECKNGQWGVEYDGIKNELKTLERSIPSANINHKLSIEIKKK